MPISAKKELVIPTFDVKARDPCTAILNMETFQWSKLAVDGRGSDVTDEVDAHVITDETMRHVYLLGGTIGYAFFPNRRPFHGVYRLMEGYQGWIQLDTKLTAMNGIIPIPLKFYRNNNWANLDAKLLAPRRK